MHVNSFSLRTIGKEKVQTNRGTIPIFLLFYNLVSSIHRWTYLKSKQPINKPKNIHTPSIGILGRFLEVTFQILEKPKAQRHTDVPTVGNFVVFL